MILLNLQGLKSDSKKFNCSSMVVLAALVTKVQLESEFINELFKIISKINITEGLFTIVHLLTCQINAQKLPLELVIFFTIICTIKLI